MPSTLVVEYGVGVHRPLDVSIVPILDADALNSSIRFFLHSRSI